MRHYTIQRIDGLPPKKDGASSMWNKASEIPRLIALRKAVQTAFNRDPPLKRRISLTVHVHVGPENTRYTGDLDNFLTGICDGLQAASNGMPTCDRWSQPDCVDCHPKNAIGILDDVEVISINASKIMSEESPWYSLELRGD